MDIRDMKVDQVGVHMTHCNMDDYVGCCKYGEDDTCPALKDRKNQNKILDMTRDDLAKNMQTMFKGTIVGADEWRPLADYIVEIIRLATKKDLSVIKNLCNVADTQISLGLLDSARETLQQALKE